MSCVRVHLIQLWLITVSVNLRIIWFTLLSHHILVIYVHYTCVLQCLHTWQRMHIHGLAVAWAKDSSQVWRPLKLLWQKAQLRYSRQEAMFKHANRGLCGSSKLMIAVSWWYVPLLVSVKFYSPYLVIPYFYFHRWIFQSLPVLLGFIATLI